jgi:hypothetical protein
VLGDLVVQLVDALLIGRVARPVDLRVSDTESHLPTLRTRPSHARVTPVTAERLSAFEYPP